MQYIRRSVTVHGLRQHSSTTPRTGRLLRGPLWEEWTAAAALSSASSDEVTSRGLATGAASPTGTVSTMAMFVSALSSVELCRDRVPEVKRDNMHNIMVSLLANCRLILTDLIHQLSSFIITVLVLLITYRYAHCSTCRHKSAAKPPWGHCHSNAGVCHWRIEALERQLEMESK